MNCEWYLKVPEESLTSISFTEFNLESSDAYQVCSNDYVTLRNDINDNTKDVTNLPIVTKFCGTTTPSDILLQGNQILIQFHSNHQNNFRGFQMSYNIIKVRNCSNLDISNTVSASIRRRRLIKKSGVWGGGLLKSDRNFSNFCSKKPPKVDFWAKKWRFI